MSVDVFGKQARTGANTFHLTLDPPLKTGIRADAEQLKLYARTAGVEDEDGFAHGSGPDGLFRPLAVGH